MNPLYNLNYKLKIESDPYHLFLYFEGLNVKFDHFVLNVLESINSKAINLSSFDKAKNYLLLLLNRSASEDPTKILS